MWESFFITILWSLITKYVAMLTKAQIKLIFELTQSEITRQNRILNKLQDHDLVTRDIHNTKLNDLLSIQAELLDQFSTAPSTGFLKPQKASSKKS